MKDGFPNATIMRSINLLKLLLQVWITVYQDVSLDHGFLDIAISNTIRAHITFLRDTFFETFRPRSRTTPNYRF